MACCFFVCVDFVQSGFRNSYRPVYVVGFGFNGCEPVGLDSFLGLLLDARSLPIEHI